MTHSNHRRRKCIPLVPVSPLVKASIQAKQAYSEATEKLSQAKQQKQHVDSLRRLAEDTKLERRRMETLEHDMESVAFATALNWDPNVLAKQITAVNCQLFQRAILDKRWLCHLDKEKTRLDGLDDFNRYLTHNLAHQLIVGSELTPASSVVPPFVNQHHQLITHWVQVAYLLVHAYRDFSGFAAIMKALALPEVRRLRKLWRGCPARTRDLYNNLVLLVSPSNEYQAYHTWLKDTLDLFQHTSPATLVIPWLLPHFASIRSIIKEYAAVTSAILSAPGARKLALVVDCLNTCQQGGSVMGTSTTETGRHVSLKPVHVEGLRSTIVPPTDLNRLVPGDLVVYHWLVSRAYLDKQQLVQESLEIKPLGNDEIPLSYEEEENEDIMFEQEFHIEIESSPPSTNNSDENANDSISMKQQQQPSKANDSSETKATSTTIGSSSSVQSATSTAIKKSRLSPTAPEFVPSSKTLASSSSTAAIATPTASSEEDPDEQWHGYLYYERKGETKTTVSDEEDEIWNGYPSPSTQSEESSEEEEEWKGYTAYKMEQDWKQEINHKHHDGWQV
ncbi:hypothetical protein K492DRAFT_146375 [Lichtheimia hyalospora FSU 10163]|nr:hypothetical protein K492DRAFT_146375 [Lichtheimia hyalospora FSU 10163]